MATAGKVVQRIEQSLGKEHPGNYYMGKAEGPVPAAKTSKHK